MSPTSVIITGGGTAGHTNPGIATAEALVQLGVEREAIHFIGGERGNESTIVPEAGFTIDLLPGRGIRRSLTLDNVRAGADLLLGVARAFRILRQRRPAVVLCLGGYASFGASVAAIIQRIPVVVTEQNARASAVNRLIGRFAKVNALPFPDTDLPDGVLTGNPIRASVVDSVARGDRQTARSKLGLPADDFVLAVWGGSLGATTINIATRELAELWATRTGITIHHAVGTRDWEEFSSSSESGGSSDSADARNYVTVEYEHRMSELLVAADAAVCRSGASTLGELAVAGLPAILVPLPGAPRDHQTANSRELVEAGGALRVDNADLTGAKLAELLEPLIENENRLRSMADAARSVARPDAAAAVARLVVKAGAIEDLTPLGPARSET